MSNRFDALRAIAATNEQFETFMIAEKGYEPFENNGVIIGDNETDRTHLSSSMVGSTLQRCYPGKSMRSSTPLGELERASDPFNSAILFLSDTGPILRAASSI